MVNTIVACIVLTAVLSIGVSNGLKREWFIYAIVCVYSLGWLIGLAFSFFGK
jgi:hypothetical protein